MKLILLISLLFILFSCEDKIISNTEERELSGIEELNVCQSNHHFEGLLNFSDITDLTATLNWNTVPESLGYLVFKIEAGPSLTLISTVSNTNSSYSINNLHELSNYEYLIKSIAPDGNQDCNTNSKEFITTARQKFKSCHDMQNYYAVHLSSGSYSIDPDLSGPLSPMDVFCEMDTNGGAWTRIFVHKTVAGLFLNKTDAKLKNKNNKDADLYSILDYLEYFKRDSKFEFWIHYPELELIDEGNHWSQESNPLSQSILGYQAIDIYHTNHFWGGLEPGASSVTLFDGSVGHSNWFYAIGSYNYWPTAGTIPGPDGGITHVELYIR